MDLKSIIGIAILIAGVFILFKDQLALLFQPKKETSVANLDQNINLVQKANTVKQATKIANEACFGELEDLILALDSAQDSEEIDFLIDKLGPKLIRRRLGR